MALLTQTSPSNNSSDTYFIVELAEPFGTVFPGIGEIAWKQSEFTLCPRTDKTIARDKASMKFLIGGREYPVPLDLGIDDPLKSEADTDHVEIETKMVALRSVDATFYEVSEKNDRKVKIGTGKATGSFTHIRRSELEEFIRNNDKDAAKKLVEYGGEPFETGKFASWKELQNYRGSFSGIGFGWGDQDIPEYYSSINKWLEKKRLRSNGETLNKNQTSFQWSNDESSVNNIGWTSANYTLHFGKTQDHLKRLLFEVRGKNGTTFHTKFTDCVWE